MLLPESILRKTSPTCSRGRWMPLGAATAKCRCAIEAGRSKRSTATSTACSTARRPPARDRPRNSIHAESQLLQPCAHDWLVQQRPEQDERRPLQSRLGHDEIVMLLLHRDETEPVLFRNGVDRETPIRAALCDRRGHGIVRFRLYAIAGRLPALEQPIDQDPRAAARIAIDQRAVGIDQRK